MEKTVTEAVSDDNDYRVRVNGKPKTYHLNLLKKFSHGKTKGMRYQEIRGSADSSWSFYHSDSGEYAKGSGMEEVVDADELLHLSAFWSNERVEYAMFGKKSSSKQEIQARQLIYDFGDKFTDLLETKKRWCNIKSSLPMRARFHARRTLLLLRSERLYEWDVASMIKMAVICISLSPYTVSRTDDEGSRDDLAIDLSGISNLRNWTSAKVIGRYR